MDRIGGGVAVRACAFVAIKLAVLLTVAYVFDADWPHETPTRAAWENWLVFIVLVALCVSINFAVYVTLVLPMRVSRFAMVLVVRETAALVMFEFAFIGAMLWPQHFSLALDWRLRTITAMLLVASVAFDVALLLYGNATELPPWQERAKRLGLWLLLLAGLAFVYWFFPWAMDQ